MVAIKITKVQEKLVKEIYGKGDFYEVEEVLYFHSAEAEKTYRVDFDETVYKRMDGEESDSKDTTVNKKKIEDEMENKEQEHADLTAQQYEEGYWKTTDETKIDGSTLMMETRISRCIEATGKSREECSKEVKARMKKNGSENTNTEDMEKEEPVEEVKNEEVKEDMEEEEVKEDTIEVCKEKFDFLESFYEDNKEKEATFATRLDLLESTIAKYKEKEAQKIEETLAERIVKFSTDFVVSEEEIKKKLNGRKGKEGIKFIEDMEGFITLAVKKEEKPEETGNYNAADFLSHAETQAKKMRADLRHID